MKSRPIIFSAPMIRALLDGRKTQTRRVVKPQPLAFVGPLPVDLSAGFCPYGQPGDLIWVREAFQPLLADDGEHGLESRWRESDYKTGKGWTVSYPATDGIVEFYDMDTDSAFCDHVTPSIHMPRWASRLTLRITDVRVQRVQEISDEDAYEEGTDHWCGDYITRTGTDKFKNIRSGFEFMWDSINAKRGYPWESNPWCWCLTFEVIQKNVDEVLREAV